MATPEAAEVNTASTPRKRTSTAAKAKTAKPKAEAAEKPATKPTPAKPEARTAKKTPAENQAPEVNFSEQVSRLAYQYWEERGCPEGSPHEDWFRAEQELSRA